jgi:non-ribosomal peptide synthase protein (TIGR01720 family)
MDSPQTLSETSGLEIAIIGMAGRFPGATSVEQFWRNIRDGVESITFFSEEELLAAGIAREVLGDANYVKAKGVLEDVEMFDAQFFGFNPREAEIMDPQQRIFLECAWGALENAGYDSERCERPIGVYAGVGMNTYFLNLLSNEDIVRAVGTYQTLIGNDKDYLPTRVSYKLNLKGPSVAVQTACSTSLVAVHLACHGLLSGECSIALAGGVAVTFPHKSGYLYQREGISSPDGHCRAFDARAQGTVAGNGVGVVVLKRLEDALADGDHIHAVIKGSAINNDGSDKIGFTAPSIEGQAQVIAEAHAVAGVSADTITYVEAHGTGTTLGDPIEVAALTQAFRHSTTRPRFCALASVKTNVGHLDAAAGVAGLIKAALALRHRQLPPSLHFEEANPKMGLDESPFYINGELREWAAAVGERRRAGVSSFGIGGTNAHLVLEEAPAPPPADPNRRPFQLITLSAKTETVLEQATANLAQFFEEQPEANLADVAFTLHVGREEWPHRRAAVCRDARDAARALRTLDSQVVSTAKAEQGSAQVAMMFSGQGSQYAGMGRELYNCEPTFCEWVDKCASLLQPHLSLDIRQVIFGAEAAEEPLQQTALAQPALFVIEYALAQLLAQWGVRPGAMIGHSVGEYVAACLAGVFSLEEALRLVAARARLMQKLPGGSMLMLPLAEAEVIRLLAEYDGGAVSLAAVNAPAACVVSGPTVKIEELQELMSGRGVEGRQLRTSHAFHSWMMEPILEEFKAEIRRTRLAAPRIPYISNLNGRWITEEEATDPEYWVRHLRQTVRFTDGVGELLRSGPRVLLEVGPGQTLCSLTRLHNPGESRRVVVASVRPPYEQRSDVAYLLQALGRLQLAGVEIDWPQFYAHESRRRIPLPTYPFDRERFWIEAHSSSNSLAEKNGHSSKREDIGDWFYVPVWKQSLGQTPRAAATKEQPQTFRQQQHLLFTDECRLGAQLAERLEARGHLVAIVRAGDEFQCLSDSEFTIVPREREHYTRLFETLRERQDGPDVVTHLWNVDGGADAASRDELFEQSQQRGYESLLFLAQALGEHSLSRVSADEQSVREATQVCIVSDGLQSVTGEEALCPEKATLLGVCRVMSQEYPDVSCRSIDVVVPASGTQSMRQLVTQLLDEVTTKSSDVVVAYRGRRRWTQSFEHVRLEPQQAAASAPDECPAGASEPATSAPALPARLRRRGVYLLTGGTGGIGLALARYLARTAQARLILVGRRGLGEAGGSEAEEVRRRRGQIAEVEEAGGEVLVAVADVSDEGGMREAVRLGRERFGEIHGIIHAAGVPGGGIMQLMTATNSAAAPKVNGTRVLESLFKDEALDFMLLFSSHRSILGGLGRADYCAANAYLDAFARANPLNKCPYVCSIIWDGWQEVGMAAEAARQNRVEPEEGMLTAEGVEAFARALDGAWPELVVSTRNFPSLVAESKQLKSTDALQEAHKTQSPQPLHARPEIQTPYVAPRNEAEQVLADIWQQLLGLDHIGINDNFFELGGDSVLMIQIIAKANKVGLRLTPQQIFQHQTIAELAAISGTSQTIHAEQGTVSGGVHLTPIQRWFFELDVAEPHHWNQALLLEVNSPLDAAHLERAVAHLLQHHDAFRMRFTRDGESWRQVNAAAEATVPLSRVNLSTSPDSELRHAIEEAAGKAQSSLNLAEGPLVRVVYFELGSHRAGRLLIVAHHLVVDAISWRIILEDLNTAYEQSSRGEAIALPGKTTSFKTYAECLLKYAQTEAIWGELDYWLAAGKQKAEPLPRDFAVTDEANTESTARTLRVGFGAEETRSLLQEVPRVYRTQINDVLLTALVRAFSRWTGHNSLPVDLEGHGRDAMVEDVDITRTVGWFTTLYPVLLSVEENDGHGEALKRVKEQLRAVPNQGLGYGLLRYLYRDERVTEELRRIPRAEISFLYLGQLDQAIAANSRFAPARESRGVTASPRAKRSHLLSVSSFVTGGQLQLDWTYSESLHATATVERLAESYLQTLRELVDHCLNTMTGGYTPSDFPDAELSQEELDRLLAGLSGAEE